MPELTRRVAAPRLITGQDNDEFDDRVLPTRGPVGLFQKHHRILRIQKVWRHFQALTLWELNGSSEKQSP